MKKTLLITCAVLSSFFLGAQDFHLTQFDAAALNLNPSLTGAFNGKYRIHGHYRTQWQAINRNPFQTGLIAFDMNIKKGFSAGVQIANYNAGTGSYNEFSMLFSGGYKMALDKKKHHKMSFGIQMGLFQKSINFSRLTFGQQYIANANGGTFDTSIPSGESFPSGGIANFDLNVGLTYFYSNIKSRFNPFVGLAACHINMPNESFYGDKNKLPIRYIANAGVRIGINSKFSLTPKIMYEHQRKANEILVSVLGQYYLNNVDIMLLFGPTFRSKDAVMLEVGAKWNNLQFRMSYDFNISKLNVSTNGRGGTELSLTYIIKQPNPNPIPSCPRL